MGFENFNSVELTEVAGSDLNHALSAWTSTSRELTEEKLSRVDKLLAMLAKDEHGTPFEKSYIQFLCTAETASHIHFLKHRIGVSINGESARYRELTEDKFYVPDDWPSSIQDKLISHTLASFDLYHETIDSLVTQHGLTRKRAKESARFFLPYSNQLRLDISFNFRSFMHFQLLRNSEHAQKEIRDIAQEMLDLVRETGRFNASLDAFGFTEDYRVID